MIRIRKMKNYFNAWADANGSHYKFTNIFISQGAVCQKHKELEEWNVNPLTIRLCLLQAAFKNLFDARLSIRQRTSNPGYKYDTIQTRSVSGATSSMFTVEPGYIGETFSSDIHDVYKNFYTFCSFFSASLDRLASEIHILYRIGSPDTIDWRKFKTKNGTNGALFSNLAQANSDLSDIIYKSDFSRIMEIRDAFEHGKKIDISSGDPNAGFDFTFKHNNVEDKIVELSHSQIMDLLKTCEEFYQKIK
jgi:hypothetical protein